MKSLFFYFNSLQPSGGIERVITTLANKFANDFNITIVVKDRAISYYQLDVRIKFISLNNKLEFDMKSKFNRFFSAINSIIFNTIALRKFFKKNSFDYYYLAHPLNVLEFHLARGVRNSDTIITEHGAPNAYNIFYKKIKKWLYPKAKKYIVPTTTDTEYYRSINFSAIYLPHFRSIMPYEKAKLNENIALTIGRYTDVKQQIALLRVWNNIVNKRNIRNWKLNIVGEGELFQEFQYYINSNKLNDYVQLLPPRKDVEFYYKQASLFLLTSKSEGFGMVLLEAISFGLPCISYDCPSGPKDIIKNNVNGYLLKINDELALEQAILIIVNNPEVKIKMGSESFSMSQNWNDSNLLKQWFSILN